MAARRLVVVASLLPLVRCITIDGGAVTHEDTDIDADEVRGSFCCPLCLAPSKRRVRP